MQHPQAQLSRSQSALGWGGGDCFPPPLIQVNRSNLVFHQCFFYMGNRTVTVNSSACISIHPHSNYPNKAWDIIKVKQKQQNLIPMSPEMPLQDNHLRFVCISDTHSQLEKGSHSIPFGDVLLHGGDFSKIGLPKEIRSFNDSLGRLPHKLKVIIAGNHDLTMDLNMVNNQRDYLKKQFGIREEVFEDYLRNAGLETSRQLLTNCIYLQDSGINICGINIYGSPWQPEFCNWAFNLSRGEPLLEKWNLIPNNTDILLTHGPPLGYGDLCSNNNRAGCVELLSTIQWRVKPRFHVFGHVHEGYGITSDGYTTFINASTCTLSYKPTNQPVVFDFPIPEGRTKHELENIPHCNL